MTSPEKPSEGRTDVAALSAAIVAVAVSMLVVEGPFHPVGAVVAVTLASVIVGYVWESPRPSRRRSVAVAAVLGVIAIQIVGFLFELYLAHDRWSFLREGKLTCPVEYASGTYWTECTHPHSMVDNSWLIATWGVVTVLIFVADRCRQRNKRPLEILAALAGELRD
jgi:hypothetical protein